MPVPYLVKNENARYWLRKVTYISRGRCESGHVHGSRFCFLVSSLCARLSIPSIVAWLSSSEASISERQTLALHLGLIPNVSIDLNVINHKFVKYQATSA